MFGLRELFFLVISAFIILPIVVFLRELGYVIAAGILGATNIRITLGSGPRLFKSGVLDVRRHYHIYSWFSYDTLKRTGKFAYVFLYISPIMINVLLGITINALLYYDVLQSYERFWHQFIFYIFYFVLFDILPMKMVYGRPNNGKVIYQMLRYGKRVDTNKEPFLPSTTDIEKRYLKDMEALERDKKALENNGNSPNPKND
jgi:hypothetical protein